MTNSNLTLSHGESVLKGEVAVSNFLRRVIEKSGDNRRYIGSFEDLTNLTKTHIDDFDPGVGSVENDVRLVNVPVDGFFIDLVEITPEIADRVKVKFEARVEGESPVPKLVFESDDLTPASFVKIVIYRADVLAKDDSRSSDAEWEIVAILAQSTETVPMHPSTMARNALNQPGGTKRTYTSDEWAEATDFWQRHAYITAPAV